MRDFYCEENLWPFSLLPEKIAKQYGVSRAFLRPFGETAEDLDVDFQWASAPQLTTDILQKCLLAGKDQIQKELVWDLPISSRLQGLLILATRGGDLSLEMTLVCQNSDCQKKMDIEITLKELTQIQKPTYDRQEVDVQKDGLRLRMRRPTGRDQRNWLKQKFSSQEEAMNVALDDLSLAGNELSDSGKTLLSTNKDILQAVERALDEIDPLINLEYNITCPECQKSGNYAIKLEEWAYKKLKSYQDYLIQTIHLLAKAYHWSEEEILTLPAWRRKMYLGMLERDI